MCLLRSCSSRREVLSSSHREFVRSVCVKECLDVHRRALRHLEWGSAMIS